MSLSKRWLSKMSGFKQLRRGRMRALTPAFIALRRYSNLINPPHRMRGDVRPHLLVVVPWLPLAGAEILLADVLNYISADWHITILTTMRDTHRLESRFKIINPSAGVRTCKQIAHRPSYCRQRE